MLTKLAMALTLAVLAGTGHAAPPEAAAEQPGAVADDQRITAIREALLRLPYLSGEPAEEVVEPVAGAIEPWVEPHEDAALVALVLAEAPGVLALGALWFARRRTEVPRQVILASLVLALRHRGGPGLDRQPRWLDSSHR